MLESTRDRIVGGVFLVALAGILLPMWFDGAGVEPLAPIEVRPPQVPERPSIEAPTDDQDWAFADEVEAVADRGPISAAGVGVAATVGQPLTPPPESTAAREPASTANDNAAPAAGTWSIQVASLGSMAAGKALKDRLIESGFHAFVTEVRTGEGRAAYRVNVGPFVDREEADRVRTRLKERMQLDGLVRQFEL